MLKLHIGPGHACKMRARVGLVPFRYCRLWLLRAWHGLVCGLGVWTAGLAQKQGLSGLGPGPGPGLTTHIHGWYHSSNSPSTIYIRSTIIYIFRHNLDKYSWYSETLEKEISVNICVSYNVHSYGARGTKQWNYSNLDKISYSCNYKWKIITILRTFHFSDPISALCRVIHFIPKYLEWLWGPLWEFCRGRSLSYALSRVWVLVSTYVLCLGFMSWVWKFMLRDGSSYINTQEQILRLLN
jgi:hypothetical protein